MGIGDGSIERNYDPGFKHGSLLLYIATLITPKVVIPAKAGIEEKTGFRVKPGMTNWTGFMSACILRHQRFFNVRNSAKKDPFYEELLREYCLRP